MAIVVQNWYIVHAGREDEALGVRRDASRVRAEAGQPVGRILVPSAHGPAIPHFIWECDYPDEAARLSDATWADESQAFADVRGKMAPLLERFERITFAVEEPPF
jgi:hypothetical protein